MKESKSVKKVNLGLFNRLTAVNGNAPDWLLLVSATTG